MGAREGDLLEVSTPRGSVRARLRVSGIRDGVLFLPFPPIRGGPAALVTEDVAVETLPEGGGRR